MTFQLFHFFKIRVLFIALSCCSLLSQGQTTKPIFLTNDTGKIAADTILSNCSKAEQVGKIISQAISIGAPIYNSGYHLACYRIYEWAGYKILYEYGPPCKEVEKVLKSAIEKSHGDYSDLEKAWIMREAFDKIMGVPTQTVDPEKKADTDRKG